MISIRARSGRLSGMGQGRWTGRDRLTRRCAPRDLISQDQPVCGDLSDSRADDTRTEAILRSEGSVTTPNYGPVWEVGDPNCLAAPHHVHHRGVWSDMAVSQS